MSWTDKTTVKTHFKNAETGCLHFENEPVTLESTTTASLLHRLLGEDSETVKWCTLKTPASDGPITLSGADWEDLTHSNIKPQTVLVSLNIMTSHMYVEEKDYIIDYEQGRIRRTSSSTIPDPTPVMVYYLYDTVFDKTDDYTIDYDAGTLTRVSDGDIPDGATVLVDYDVSMPNISDALIEQAITEAEDKILAHLSTDYGPSSTDQGLKTGATELTIAIVAEAEAMKALTCPELSDADNRAQQWMELSKQLELQAWRTLAPFLDPTVRRSSIVQSNLYGTE